MGALLLWAFITCVAADNYQYLSLNDICKSGPEAWRCKTWSDCPALKEAVQNGQRPDVCSFQGRELIICCPPSGQPTTPTRQSSPRPTNRPTTTKPFWLKERAIEEGPVWGSSRIKNPTGNNILPKPTIKKPTTPTTTTFKSKADQMCEVYSKYVYRVEKSPVLIGNQNPKEIVISECNIETLIVGGIDAKPKEFPHMALIGYGERPRIEWLCGGSLISPKFVLSAAHCSKPNSKVANWVKLGDLDTAIDTDDADPVEIKIFKRHDHPLYNVQSAYHDIALYELEREVKLGSYIRPICLHTSKEINSGTAVASGWGNIKWGGPATSMLQKVNITLVSNRMCNTKYGEPQFKEILPNGIVDDRMFCAGEQKKDACQGDSGGPLQIERKDIYCMYSQVGIVSFGEACATTYPGVYTRISNYLPWIEKIVWP